MNHKTIRAYQFKADEAVRTLEEAGAQWVVGKGKPHWVMPIEPKVDVEEIKHQQAIEFAKTLDKNFVAMCKELFGEPKAVPAVDNFELGPQTFPDRHKYIHKLAEIRKLPSWHRLGQSFVGSLIQVHDITYISRSRYKGYCVVFKTGESTAWLPLSCIKFKL